MLPWETNMVHVQSALSHIAKEFFFLQLLKYCKLKIRQNKKKKSQNEYYQIK